MNGGTHVSTVDEALDAGRLTEPAAARTVSEWCTANGADLTVASSMPVRDVEWFGGPAAAAHAASSSRNHVGNAGLIVRTRASISGLSVPDTVSAPAPPFR